MATDPKVVPKSSGKLANVRITFLDDCVQHFQLSPNALGRDLYAMVMKQIHLVETDYFDLDYTNKESVKCWLDHEKPLLKQTSSTGDLVFTFRVKFYVPHPNLLEDEYTRYLFALQVKKDLYEDRLHSNENTSALLSAFIVQAEIGDFLEDEYLNASYLSNMRLMKNTTPQFLNKVIEYHQTLIGQTPAEADLNLLDTARKVDLYGIHMNNAKDHEGLSLNLSVTHMGLIVFQNITKINTFSWAKIRKISFKRKKFLIKLHPESYVALFVLWLVEGFYKDTVEFYFETRQECKNFWKQCIEHHAFFRCYSSDPVQRRRNLLITNGSSYRYSGRTEKQLTEYVRDTYTKNPNYTRSASTSRLTARTSSGPSSTVHRSAPRQAPSLSRSLPRHHPETRSNAELHTTPTARRVASSSSTTIPTISSSSNMVPGANSESAFTPVPSGWRNRSSESYSGEDTYNEETSDGSKRVRENHREPNQRKSHSQSPMTRKSESYHENIPQPDLPSPELRMSNNRRLPSSQESTPIANAHNTPNNRLHMSRERLPKDIPVTSDSHIPPEHMDSPGLISGLQNPPILPGSQQSHQNYPPISPASQTSHQHYPPGSQQSHQHYPPISPGSLQSHQQYPPISPASQQSHQNYPPISPGSQQSHQNYPPISSGSQTSLQNHPPISPGPARDFQSHPPTSSTSQMELQHQSSISAKPRKGSKHQSSVSPGSKRGLQRQYSSPDEAETAISPLMAPPVSTHIIQDIDQAISVAHVWSDEEEPTRYSNQSHRHQESGEVVMRHKEDPSRMMNSFNNYPHHYTNQTSTQHSKTFTNQSIEQSKSYSNQSLEHSRGYSNRSSVEPQQTVYPNQSSVEHPKTYPNHRYQTHNSYHSQAGSCYSDPPNCVESSSIGASLSVAMGHVHTSDSSLSGDTTTSAVRPTSGHQSEDGRPTGDEAAVSGSEGTKSKASPNLRASRKKSKHPSDRAYYLVKELFMTERTYKKDLEVWCVWMRKCLTSPSTSQSTSSAHPNMPEALSKTIFSLLDPIYDQHVTIARLLDTRLGAWEGKRSQEFPQTDRQQGDAGKMPVVKKVGDIFLSNMRILPLYRKYLHNQEDILSQLERESKSSPQFEAGIRHFESNKMCYLPVLAFLMKPYYRLSHYRLILDRLIRHYPEDHPDLQDCRAAHAKFLDVLEAYAPAHQRMENLYKLLEIERDLVDIQPFPSGSPGEVEETPLGPLVSPGRQFIREGCLQHVDHRGCQQRMFFLFSDQIIYASRTSAPHLQFRVRGQFSLVGCKAESVPEDSHYCHALILVTGGDNGSSGKSQTENISQARSRGENTSAKKSRPRRFLLTASNNWQRDLWVEAINTAVASAHVKPLSEQEILDDQPKLPEEVATDTETGDDKSIRSYASCSSELPAGGALYMGDRHPLQHRTNATVHVCWHRNLTVAMTDIHRTNQNQLSGYLLRKFKNSNGWQKLWVVFSHFCLFFYKNYQDEGPSASLPLLGYAVSRPLEDDNISKDHVLKLQYKTHVYFFRTESPYTFDRWYEVLNCATSGVIPSRVYSGRLRNN